MQDLGFEGLCYTWSNNREENELIHGRLDYFVAVVSWFDLFLEGWVKHELTTYSDHLPIWLDTEGKKVFIQGYKPFCFKIMRLKEKECTKIVEDTWQNGVEQNSLQNFVRRITRCSVQLDRRNRLSFENFYVNLKRAKI